MHKTKRYLVVIIIIALGTAGILFFQFKNRLMPTPLPQARAYNVPTSTTSDSALPLEVNLQIPFTSQAPHQNWDLPYKHFCEEASVLMAASYIKNQPILDPNDADQKMLAIQDFEIKKFGYYEDTSVEETATILREYFGLDKIEIVSDPTVTQIKSSLAEGKAVIIPVAGREIDNPYFQNPGPIYHMLVIKGYKKNGDFITNEPGTKRGADFIYKTDDIMDALHDWNSSDIDTGKKVVLVVG